jgi:hypothetical protein
MIDFAAASSAGSGAQARPSPDSAVDFGSRSIVPTLSDSDYLYDILEMNKEPF